MSVIKSVKEISPLIPEPGDKVYDSLVTHTPQEKYLKNPIYAVEVDNKAKRIKTIFRITFALFSTQNSAYLFINNISRDLSSNTPYVKSNAKNPKNTKPEDWNFKTDEIGLHATIGMFNTSTLYFVTSRLDIKDIQVALRKRETKKTLITDIVYV